MALQFSSNMERLHIISIPCFSKYFTRFFFNTTILIINISFSHCLFLFPCYEYYITLWKKNKKEPFLTLFKSILTFLFALFQLPFLFFQYYIHSEAHSASSFPGVSAANRFPVMTSAPGAKACIFFPENPIGLPPEVAKGTTLIPSKS